MQYRIRYQLIGLYDIEEEARRFRSSRISHAESRCRSAYRSDTFTV